MHAGIFTPDYIAPGATNVYVIGATKRNALFLKRIQLFLCEETLRLPSQARDKAQRSFKRKGVFFAFCRLRFAVE